MAIIAPDRERAVRPAHGQVASVSAMLLASMCIVCDAACAQSMNVEIGWRSLPSNSCAGPAGQPGTWTHPYYVDEREGPLPFLDVCGQNMRARSSWAGSVVWQYEAVDHPSTTGCDQSVLDKFLSSTLAGADSVILTFRHLRGGTYDVYTTAWHPNGSTGGSVRVNGSRPSSVGGPWPGGYVEGVTHVKHRVTIADDGGISVTVSNPIGTNLALNAIQLVHMPDAPNNDLDGDGVANGCDLCPTIQNPGVQDVDDDLIGDVCGACPCYQGHKGPVAQSAFGFTTIGCDDVNNDGVHDYIITAPFKDPWSIGILYVYSGATGQLLRTIQGPGTPGANFGTAAVSGDLSGVSGPCVVVGAPGAWSQAGTVHFYSLVDGRQLFGSVEGLSGNDRFGSNLWIGEIDDVAGNEVIGVPRFTDYFRVRYDQGLVSEFFSPPSVSFNAQMGRRIVPVRDVDGDGLTDLAITAPDHNMNGANYVGKVLIVSRASMWAFSTELVVLHEILGQNTANYYEMFGFDAVALGDVSGDSVPDFAIGAPQCASCTSGLLGGYVRVYSGADFSLLYQLTGPADSRQFGFSLANVGDTNGDGVTDLLIGSPGYFLQHRGFIRLVSADTGATIRTIHETAPGQRFGQHLAGLGDINGDGLADYIVGAPCNGIVYAPGFAKIYLGQRGVVADCSVPLPCPADIALPHNRTVDTDDLLALLGSWGACVNCADCPADIAPAAALNCIVDTDDLLTLLGSWNSCP